MHTVLGFVIVGAAYWFGFYVGSLKRKGQP